MDCKKYFSEPEIPDQKKYEALRAYFSEGCGTQEEVARRFGYAIFTFRAIVRDFKSGKLELFVKKKKGNFSISCGK